MPFDKPTRNLLAKIVAQCRDRLAEDIADQLQSSYGLHPDGTALDVAKTEGDRRAAEDLRALLAHFEVTAAGSAQVRRNAAYQQLVREIGFTTLNRLAALHLCEERGLVLECVRRGMASDGFQLYERLTGGALGNRYQTYRAFIENLFDELALDLGVLFDRSIPQSLVFPSEAALTEVLAWLNDPELAAHDVWQQDETIGWVYQYYNDPKERKAMRDASQAPRNSRELAVRNQFFTPRYVVEFLTDNTLGRFWYEMRWGHTRLVDQCRYLVRRPNEIFLDGEYVQHDAHPGIQRALQGDFSQLPDGPTWNDLQTLALMIHGYDLAPALGLGECGEFANSRMSEYQGTGRWRGNSIGLWICLFFEQRRWHHFGYSPEGEDLATILALYAALREALANEQSTSDQEELLKQPVYIPPRDRKDPRDLKILDPACGSGHFLLYAFDLLTTIYEEAWGDPAIPPLTETGTRLADDYADLDALRRAAPGLILRHNLHGIDIDPRAVQIAALALWLRAQRAYQDLGLAPTERPRITKTNLVTAEPMPGDRELLDEFVRDLRPRVLGDLVRVVFEKMELAGEAGLLLKIDEELEEAIAEAYQQWASRPETEQLALFPKDQRPNSEQLPLFDVSGITDAAFWETAGERVLEELHRYATRSENGRGTRRRLFADDTAQGFAFLDLCSKQYDVVLMNPPFGATPERVYTYLKSEYPKAFIDVLAAFVQRGMEIAPSGFVGAITSRAHLYTKTLSEWRKDQLIGNLITVADLGDGVLDNAVVRTCSSVLSNSQVARCIFFDLISSSEKDLDLEDLILSLRGSSPSRGVFEHDTMLFNQLPQSRILYSLPPEFWVIVGKAKSFEPTAGTVRSGLTTYDDERFLRLMWEAPKNEFGLERIWVPISKGGYFETFFGEVHLALKWYRDGAEVGEHNRNLYGTDAQSRRASAYYFQACLTYPRRTTKGFSARALQPNCIFGDKGPGIIPLGEVSPSYLLGFFHSHLIRSLIHIQSHAGSYETGILKQLPWVAVSKHDESVVKKLADTIWRVKVEWYSRDETDPYFTPFFLQRRCSNLQGWHYQLLSEVSKCNQQITQAVRDISEIVDIEYEVSEAYRLEDFDISLDDHLIQDRLDLDISFGVAYRLLSLALGFVVGRWDIRFALNPILAPQLGNPFDPLPICPPGMLIGSDGLPATPGDIVSEAWLRARPNAITLPLEGSFEGPSTIPDEAYPVRIAWDGILVDDPGLGEHPEPHPSDVVRRVREVLAVLWPENHDAIETEACEILGVRDLRDYFRKPTKVFADHLKRYSKSRRKAPIYWPLSTSSGSYTLWLYYHRLDDQTLYTAVNRYVTPKIEQVEGYVARLEGDLAQATGRAASNLRDQLDQVHAFLAELREFREELLRVAGLPYKPNLNDGVIINAAPLHRLFGLRKWAKDTEAVWRKLEKGEYDWAHMAYTLWPERVQEVCKHDRSIAIAHGLEELCQVPEKGAKKREKRQRKRGQESQTELP